MTVAYTVMVQNQGGVTMGDASAIYSARDSHLAESARDKATESTAHFMFPVDAPDLPNIREGAEIWAGWTEDGTFLSDPAPFGGFIMQQEGWAVGDTHHIACTVSSYNILLSRASVIGWPTGDTPGAVPERGMPPDLPVTDWLVGSGIAGLDVDGIVRTCLPNLDYTGIDPTYGLRIFTAQTLPGNPDPDFPIVGQWSFTTLDKVLQDIMGAIRIVWPFIEPVYWLEAAAWGDAVRPRFRLIDNADLTGALRGRFTVAPASGEYGIR